MMVKLKALKKTAKKNKDRFKLLGKTSTRFKVK